MIFPGPISSLALANSHIIYLNRFSSHSPTVLSESPVKAQISMLAIK